MGEGAVQIVDDEVDEPNVGSRPPGWMIVAVVLVGIGVASFVVSQASTNVGVPADTGVSLPDDENPPFVSPGTERRLRGHVAVAVGENLRTFRPGGSVVSRSWGGRGIIGGTGPYPILMSAGYLLYSGSSGWMFDIDLAEEPVMFGTNRDIIPGAEPGVVWFSRRSGPTGDYLWVASVDVESLTIGERVDITDVFTYPVAGVADGLIVVPIDQDTYGRFAYWSPTDGLAPIGLRDPSQETVVTASGNLVVVAVRGGVRFFDISSGSYVSSFPFDFGEAVTSACLSPDREHVVVVGSNGDAIVGSTTTGEVMPLKDTGAEQSRSEILVPNQLTHGIGWTTADQVVFIGVDEDGVDEDGSHLFGFDIDTRESFYIAGLRYGAHIAASGAMC
jgi:hypothetical protein